MKKIRVLHVIYGLALGGAENFIYNVLQLIDPNRFIFDFALQLPEIRHKKFQELIIERGGKIYIIPDFRKNPFGQYQALSKILESGYDFVHIHMNAFINPIPAITASKFNNRVIIHSHNTKNDSGGRLGYFLHKLHCKLYLKDKFVNLSCGRDAGKWMFGRNQFQVVHNAIDLKKFSFSNERRQRIRALYNLKNEFIIGQIGKLEPVKNQKFSIFLLNEYLHKFPRSTAKLLFVGMGRMEEELKNLVKRLNLEDRVIFAGGVHNPEDYYSAIDCQLLPSLYEGFAFVAVEGQGAGLRVIASDNNTVDIDISNSVKFCSLTDPNSWIDKIRECETSYDREQIQNRLQNSPFDSLNLKIFMENFYTPED